jgi:putative transposase
MRFGLVDAAKKDFPVQRLCKVLDVSASGYFAWKSRPACRRQREDMVLLAHVRSAFTLSNGTYGSPRMVYELRYNGLTIGRRRVARLMRENGLRARQKRRFKRTTDSLHAFPIAPNLLDQDFAAAMPNQKWGADISYVWAGSIWRSSSTCSPGASSAGQLAIGSTKNWHCRLCAGPSPCGALPSASFTTRTEAANTAPSIIRPS